MFVPPFRKGSRKVKPSLLGCHPVVGPLDRGFVFGGGSKKTNLQEGAFGPKYALKVP